MTQNNMVDMNKTMSVTREKIREALMGFSPGELQAFKLGQISKVLDHLETNIHELNEATDDFIALSRK